MYQIGFVAERCHVQRVQLQLFPHFLLNSVLTVYFKSSVCYVDFTFSKVKVKCQVVCSYFLSGAVFVPLFPINEPEDVTEVVPDKVL